jgi:hypothetical protein
MDGVDLDCCNHIEPGLFESKAHAARTGEEIDPNGAHFTSASPVCSRYILIEG